MQVLAVGAASVVQRLAENAGSVSRPAASVDPKFAALAGDVRAKQKTLSAHPSAASEAGKARGAAKPPQDDREAQGKAANAEKMNAAKPGEFDKAAFIRAVNEAIAAQAPKNLDEADKFGDSGKADAVKGQVQGQVASGKDASAKAIATTTNAPPDTAAAKEKTVTPLVADRPPGVPATPDSGKAVPGKAPASATDFSAGPKQVDQQMAQAQVTEDQLAKSNEPQFTGALKEKKAGEANAATAPGQIRTAESQTLSRAKAQAAQAGGATMAALAEDRKQAGAKVGAGKEGAKSEDEAKRAQVTATLQKVFDATKKDVEDVLSGLDKKVDDAFTRGEKAARDAFTAEHKRRMDEYKNKRYSGFTGKLRWVKDKFAGLPEEANQIFVVARQGYVTRMQQVISDVADIIGVELNRAEQRIAAGHNQLQAEVTKLPADLQAIGKQAAKDFAGKFDELTESVDAKGKELINTLASKYNEALKAVDAEIAAEKEKNKGLVAKAVDAVGGVIKTIMQLKDMLLGVLAKAAQAVMAILRDPIGFLGHLVSAVGAGLRAFLANIGEHLKKGLISWLTGAMAGAGLELPAKFDLRGIILMIASLLGLTWKALRARIVQRGVPEQAMGAVEKSVPVAQKLQSEGVAGVTEEIKEQVGDIKGNLFGKISEYLIPTILVAGITWIVSLLNPASAFVRACKMIIDFVMFIVNQGAQIIEFVNSVLDAIIAIAGGAVAGVPALIEKALARSVPVLIGALAAILGVGGIANKVKSFFHALAKPINKAVNWVVDKIVTLGRKIWAKLKAKAKGKGKDGKEADRADVRAVARQAAQRGWTFAGQKTATQVVSRADLEAALAKAETARGGVQVQVDVAEAGAHWTVRATAGKGANRAIVEHGKGWIAKGENGASWYAAKDHSAFNRSMIEESFDKLRDGDEPENGDLRTAYTKKVTAAKNITVTQQGRLDSRARGLKLTIGMEPFTGVIRDKQIATTIKIAPNTNEAKGQVPAKGEAFPYEIGKPRVSLTSTPAGAVNKQLQPFPAGGFPVKDDFTGFVVNMVAVPDSVKSDLATRYLDQAWSGDPQLQAVATNRTAVVAGVNAFERLNPETTETAEKEVKEAVGGVTNPGNMLMAIFGFLWRPRWVNKSDGKKVSLATARAAYKNLDNDGDRAKAEDGESTMRQSKTLPYGALREIVLRSTYTRQAVEILSTRNHRVHIFSQDPDGGLTTVGGDPMGVLAKYTKVLAAMKQHPMLTIGGYSFKGFNWAADADPRTVQLTLLANEIDRAIRAAVAKKMPRMIYPTEPNLLVKAWTHDQTEQAGIFQDPKMMGRSGSFWGADQAEGWAMRKRLWKGFNGDKEDFVAYVPDAATTTDPVPGDPSRGFVLSAADVHHANRSRRRNPHPADALLAQSQTYASAKRLAMEMSMSESPGAGLGPQGEVEKVYSEVGRVIRMMVDNPVALGTEELNTRLGAVDAKVAQVLEGQKERDDLVEKAGEITKDIIRALSSADLVETWSELAQVLKQIVEPSGK